ncbi:MAG: hypothetical protein J6C60_04515 [Alistipes sp.]|nr:hypothetical protein [Alistipes sp.]
MRPTNDDFNPVTEEELRRQQEDEEFRRRVRSEVRRIQSGEADEDIERDREAEAEAEAAEQAELHRERKRRSRLSWQLISGSILTSQGVRDIYRYLAVIAGMSFLSIMVMFATLYADLRFSQVERDLQLLRERSIRLQEELHRKTTHQAVREELARRGIDLRDPERTKTVVDN